MYTTAIEALCEVREWPRHQPWREKLPLPDDCDLHKAASSGVCTCELHADAEWRRGVARHTIDRLPVDT